MTIPRRVVTSVREVTDADGLQIASNELFRPGFGRAGGARPPRCPPRCWRR